MTATPLPRPHTHPPAPPPVPTRADDPAAGTLAVASAALRGGFVLLPRTLLHAPGLSRDAKLLYAVLLSYAWQAGSCFPSSERLQADLQCSVNSVTKWLQELERTGLVTRRRRGQGKTTLYTLHDPPPPPPGLHLGAGVQTPKICESEGPPEKTPKICESGVANPAALGPQSLRPEYDSGEGEAAEHHPPVVEEATPAPPATLAPPGPPTQEPPGAGDDDVLELLVAHGVTRRIAQDLATTHDAEAIRQQLAWQRYRPAATSPAGALVQAIRDAWPPPPAWLEAREHAAAVGRQAEEERLREAEAAARRREWEARPPEERIAGRLAFWLQGRRAKRQEPTPAEIEAKRAELLAGLLAPPAPTG